VVAVGRNRLAGAVLIALFVGLLGLTGCDWFQPRPSVNFDLSPASGSRPLLVDFTPSVEGQPAAYVWDFGDGSTSSEDAPSHVYYTAGVYSVTLTVSYGTGAIVSVTKTDCVEVRKGFSAKEAPGLYWLDRAAGAIRSGPLDGGTVTTLVTGIADGRSLAVGLGRIYWIANSTVHKVDLNGANFRYLFYFYGNPQSLCVDVLDSKLYWTNLPNYYGYGGIVRSDALGGSQESWALEWGAGGCSVPWLLAPDFASSRLYYMRMYYDYEGVHPRAAAGPKSDLISASIEWTYTTQAFAAHSVIGGLSRSTGMAVDAGLAAGARYIYWTDPEGGRIERCKIDGTGRISLVVGIDSPKGIAVDIYRGWLYWSDQAGIHRMTLDGTLQRLIYPGVKADCLTINALG
jgi:PKD repeat protein